MQLYTVTLSPVLDRRRPIYLYIPTFYTTLKSIQANIVIINIFYNAPVLKSIVHLGKTVLVRSGGFYFSGECLRGSHTGYKEPLAYRNDHLQFKSAHAYGRRRRVHALPFVRGHTYPNFTRARLSGRRSGSAKRKCKFSPRTFYYARLYLRDRPVCAIL